MDVRRLIDVGNPGIAEAQIRRERRYQHEIRRDETICPRVRGKLIGKSRKQCLSLEQTYMDALYADPRTSERRFNEYR